MSPGLIKSLCVRSGSEPDWQFGLIGDKEADTKDLITRPLDHTQVGKQRAKKDQDVRNGSKQLRIRHKLSNS